jgi:uncharacterized membrane protein
MREHLNPDLRGGRPSAVSSPHSAVTIGRRSALTAGVFLLLDALWLGLLMGEFYKRHLGDLARRAGPDFDPIWWAAGLVYVVLIAGIVTFVLPKAEGRPLAAAGWGALFGLVTYGTYDLTCQAVIRDWPVVMTVVDMTWGAIICGITAAVALALDVRIAPAALPPPAA